MSPVEERIKKTVEEHPVVLFMKGSPEAPQCGFSKQTAEVLKACGSDFFYIDVLAEPDIRTHLPTFSNWPTFPQIFIRGELIGGCDIALDLFQKGALQDLISNTSATS